MSQCLVGLHPLPQSQIGLVFERDPHATLVLLLELEEDGIVILPGAVVLVEGQDVVPGAVVLVEGQDVES